MTPLAEVKSYEDLIVALRQRQGELDISYETIDAVAGWAERYAAKVMTQTEPRSNSCGDGTRDARGAVRRLGMQSLGLLLRALSCKLILVEDPEALARNRSRYVPRDEAHVISARGRWQSARRTDQLAEQASP
ncbi:hypothetical protein BRAS3843_1730021 [Bradyrhizobium sp. STM 3843]|uniref:hypothetical protein n=1 Tax=Bradyrhizobium sp. STM 3843 TaxID=551947 RepID=UPI0002407126|nr:hypothetical protein [Bradyrhizobium sp. STM 3843]CCE06452.1 hypothetical protein BRAS3843_1730021 [Bradyrhizobium sp. STM 3843]